MLGESRDDDQRLGRHQRWPLWTLQQGLHEVTVVGRLLRYHEQASADLDPPALDGGPDDGDVDMNPGVRRIPEHLLEQPLLPCRGEPVPDSLREGGLVVCVLFLRTVDVTLQAHHNAIENLMNLLLLIPGDFLCRSS